MGAVTQLLENLDGGSGIEENVNDEENHEDKYHNTEVHVCDSIIRVVGFLNLAELLLIRKSKRANQMKKILLELAVKSCWRRTMFKGNHPLCFQPLYLNRQIYLK